MEEFNSFAYWRLPMVSLRSDELERAGLGQEGPPSSMDPLRLQEHCESLGLWRQEAAVSVVVMTESQDTRWYVAYIAGLALRVDSVARDIGRVFLQQKVDCTSLRMDLVMRSEEAARRLLVFLAKVEMAPAVTMSWLALTPEQLGYHLPASLGEAELLFLQRDSDWTNVFGTRLKTHVTSREGHVVVDFTSVIDLNLFLFFHGSQSEERKREKSLGSLKQLLIPRESFSAGSMTLQVQVRKEKPVMKLRSDWKKDYGYNIVGSFKSKVILKFKSPEDLVRFMFSRVANNMLEVKISGLSYNEIKSEKDAVVALHMVEYMQDRLVSVAVKLRKDIDNRLELEKSVKFLNSEIAEIQNDIETLIFTIPEYVSPNTNDKSTPAVKNIEEEDEKDIHVNIFANSEEISEEKVLGVSGLRLGPSPSLGKMVECEDESDREQ